MIPPASWGESTGSMCYPQPNLSHKSRATCFVAFCKFFSERKRFYSENKQSLNSLPGDVVASPEFGTPEVWLDTGTVPCFTAKGYTR